MDDGSALCNESQRGGSSLLSHARLIGKKYNGTGSEKLPFDYSRINQIINCPGSHVDRGFHPPIEQKIFFFTIIYFLFLLLLKAGNRLPYTTFFQINLLLFLFAISSKRFPNNLKSKGVVPIWTDHFEILSISYFITENSHS